MRSFHFGRPWGGLGKLSDLNVKSLFYGSNSHFLQLREPFNSENVQSLIQYNMLAILCKQDTQSTSEKRVTNVPRVSNDNEHVFGFLSRKDGYLPDADCDIDGLIPLLQCLSTASERAEDSNSPSFLSVPVSPFLKSIGSCLSVKLAANYNFETQYCLLYV